MRVLLADPQPICHLGLNQLLEGLIETAEFIEIEDLNETRRLAKDARPDFALIHIRLPAIAPPDGLTTVVRMVPETLVIVVLILGSLADAMEMLNKGATSNLSRTAGANEFVSIVVIMLTGGLCLPKTFSGSDHTIVETAANRVPTAPLDGPQARRLGDLNNRQHNLLALPAQGKSNIGIAASLGLSGKTDRIHVSFNLKTLNVQNHIQATPTTARAVSQIAASCHAGA